MYYTGWDDGAGINCLGVATAPSPDGPFAAPPGSNGLIMCDPDGQVAIDPTEYENANGLRYLVYKAVNAGSENGRGWTIKYVRLNGAGTATLHPVTPRSAHHLLHPGSRMEAPSLFSTGRKLWMFTARGKFQTCGYYTDAWVSTNGISGDFSRVKSRLLKQDVPNAKTPCGTGGADIIGGGHFVAYHAWRGGDVTSVRDVYVATASWDSGTPVLK